MELIETSIFTKQINRLLDEKTYAEFREYLIFNPLKGKLIKGGGGKTTFTVLAASYLHYACGYNLIVVDCDYPQFSINAMRQRDAQGVDRNPALQELAATQFSELQKPTYTILYEIGRAHV